MRRKNPARRLHERLWLSLLLLASMIVLHQFLLQPTLMRMTYDAPSINLAGRQRMLSQKLAKSALAMKAADDPSERASRRSELAETLSVWRQSHAVLSDAKPLSFGGGAVSQAIRSRFQEIEPHFLAMVDASERLLTTSDPGDGNESLKRLLDHESHFLPGMQALVGLYEQEAQQHVRQLQILGLTIMAVILGALWLIQFRLVRPELITVGHEWERIEADYELLVESMTDGLVALDQNGQVEFANRRFCDMVGIPLEQLTGRAAIELFIVKQRTAFQQMLSDADRLMTSSDLQLLSTNGRLVDVMISPVRMLDVDGTFQGSLLVVTDITDRKTIEQRSRDLQSQLAHSDRLKSMGAMAAALAHEINQPLGAISNFAEGCLSRLSDPCLDPSELISPLQGILRAAHRGAEMIRRNRDFSRSRPPQSTEVSINDLIREVTEICQLESSRRGITLKMDLCEKLPKIFADRIQIQQVLINLIHNAFNALELIDRDERTVTITSLKLSEDELEVSVADSGPGISSSISKTLFEPFATSGDGTGLGLAISREIVESHEGRIWFDNPTHGGAMFHFTLPVAGLSNDSFTEASGKEGDHV